AQIAAEAGHFTMTGIIYNINQKIIRRHPHVYGDTVVSSSDDVKANWAAIKAREKAEEGAAESPASVLDGVPQALPALAQALDISQKAVDVGFEWATIDGVLDKLAEEAREITAATTPDETESEVGDLLFVMVNLARKLKVDPESALRASNARFTRRFQKLESLARDNNLRLTDLEVAAWKDLWNQAKAAVAHLE
ncbi:MAG: YabN family protein, partial [Anaerolineae bacterium]